MFWRPAAVGLFVPESPRSGCYGLLTTLPSKPHASRVSAIAKKTCGQVRHNSPDVPGAQPLQVLGGARLRKLFLKIGEVLSYIIYKNGPEELE